MPSTTRFDRDTSVFNLALRILDVIEDHPDTVEVDAALSVSRTLYSTYPIKRRRRNGDERDYVPMGSEAKE